MKDLSFNLVSPKLWASKLPSSDSNFLILATEVFVLTPESKTLCEQWIFQFQPHEKRKDLNIIQTMQKLEWKLAALLRVVTALLVQLPVHKKIISQSKLSNQYKIHVEKKVEVRDISDWPIS